MVRMAQAFEQKLVTSTTKCIFDIRDATDDNMVAYIMNERKTMPVIVYCSDTFKELFLNASISFLEMNDTNAYTSKDLRAELDKSEHKEFV